MITCYIIIRELHIFARWRNFSNCSTPITRKCSPQDLAPIRTDTSSVARNAPPYLTFLITVWFERNEKPEDGWSPYSDPVGKQSEKQQNASLRIGIQFHCRIDKVFSLVGCLLDYITISDQEWCEKGNVSYDFSCRCNFMVSLKVAINHTKDPITLAYLVSLTSILWHELCVQNLSLQKKRAIDLIVMSQVNAFCSFSTLKIRKAYNIRVLDRFIRHE